MVATSTAHKLMANLACKMVSFIPGSADKEIVDLVPGTSDECLPIARSRRFLFGIMLVTGGATPDEIEEFEIIAATDADGGGAVVVVAHAIGTAANLIGDTLWLEADVENIREVLATATHVGVRAELVASTDECALTVIEQRIEQEAGLTADYIA